ncbi:MAG: hypothetical protein JO276_12720 [Sphingomonadaceae bacterium]|nr:hypothetical protein [Sphingomonadaceae bacterium]
MLLAAAALALATPSAGPTCTLRTAVPASAREMGRNPNPWLGRCVRLDGFVSWNKFYADIGGAYAEAASDRVDRHNDGWLGLYFERGRDWKPVLRRATVYGILHDCGRDYQAAALAAGPNTLVMSTGYCHYQGGLTLVPAVFRAAGPARFERQMGEAARVRFGDLSPAGPGHDPPATVVRLADHFLDLLRTDDGPGLRALVHLWSQNDPETEPDGSAFTTWLRGEGDSPLRPLKSAAAPQRAYFQEAVRRDAAADGQVGGWHICFCRAGDCTGRWPISAIDADSAPSRPYVCLRAYRHDLGPEEPDRLGIDRQERGFTEPSAANASTR